MSIVYDHLNSEDIVNVFCLQIGADCVIIGNGSFIVVECAFMHVLHLSNNYFYPYCSVISLLIKVMISGKLLALKVALTSALSIKYLNVYVSQFLSLIPSSCCRVVMPKAFSSFDSA